MPRLEQIAAAHTDARRLEIILRRVRRRGIRIETVYDIGAHRGSWTELVRSSLPEATFFLFEANDEHATALAGTGDRYFIALLSSEETTLDFYARGGSGDSYYRETTENYVAIQPRRLRATTLDRMVEAHGLPHPDLIKADVQGAEIDVMRGAKRALGHASLVLLECPVVEYNLGAPRIDEYLAFMDERGFSPLDFVSSLWQRRRLVQVDILFGNVREHPQLVP